MNLKSRAEAADWSAVRPLKRRTRCEVELSLSHAKKIRNQTPPRELYWQSRTESPMIKTLLIPGADGSPTPHWQHWWASVDPTARIVELGSCAKPCADHWMTEIAGAVLVHPGAVLVGHSLGAIAAVHALVHWPYLEVGGALIVAPVETEGTGFGPILQRPLSVPSIVAASRNDSAMAQNRSRALADAWGANFADLGAAGRICAESGFGPWPEGRRMRDLLETLEVSATPVASKHSASAKAQASTATGLNAWQIRYHKPQHDAMRRDQLEASA